MFREFRAEYRCANRDHSIEVFQSSFGSFFDSIDHTTIVNGRTLFLFRSKLGPGGL
jgi:hypothetical protein